MERNVLAALTQSHALALVGKVIVAVSRALEALMFHATLPRQVKGVVKVIRVLLAFRNPTVDVTRHQTNFGYANRLVVDHEVGAIKNFMLNKASWKVLVVPFVHPRQRHGNFFLQLLQLLIHVRLSLYKVYFLRTDLRLDRQEKEEKQKMDDKSFHFLSRVKKGQ